MRDYMHWSYCNLAQDLNLDFSGTHSPPLNCLLTNRLNYQGSNQNLISTTHSFDQRALGLLDTTTRIVSPVALVIVIDIYVCTSYFVCFFFPSRQVGFIFQELNPNISETHSPAGWMNASHKPTELSRIRLKLDLNNSFLWSASTQPTWHYYRNCFTPGSGNRHRYICMYQHGSTSMGRKLHT